MERHNPYRAPEAIGDRGQASRGGTSIRSLAWSGAKVGAMMAGGLALVAIPAVIVAIEWERIRAGGLLRDPDFIVTAPAATALYSLVSALFGAVCGAVSKVAAALLRRLRELGGAPR
jgi:hypothetical protein